MIALHRALPLVVLALVVEVSPAPQAAERPQLVPTRDVDISYDMIRPQQPRLLERVRWSADQRLERVDHSDRSTTILDHAAGVITLLAPASRSYRKFEGAPRPPTAPPPGAAFKRGDAAVVAGLACVDWSWTEEAQVHTVCVTADGVLLRLVVDGSTVMLARTVSFRRQPAALFRVPPNYAPALAPEDGAGPGL